MKSTLATAVYIFLITAFSCKSILAMDQLSPKTRKASLDAQRAIQQKCNLSLESALNNGASPYYTNNQGDNLLMLATQDFKILPIVLGQSSFQNPDVLNHQNNAGVTLLMMLCSVGSQGHLNKLIGFEGINLNMQDNNGNTAAHYAASHGEEFHRRDMVIVLLRHNADFTIKNKKGITPIPFLIEKNQTLPKTILHKIMEQADANGNNQLHLWANAQADNLNGTSKAIIFMKIAKQLDYAELGMLSHNNMHQSALDIVMEEYQTLLNIYQQEESIKAYKALTRQEIMLHKLLIFYAKELGSPIKLNSPFIKILNLETIVACNQALLDPHYYEKSIEDRNRIKQEILSDIAYLGEILTWAPLYQ